MEKCTSVPPLIFDDGYKNIIEILLMASIIVHIY